MRTVPWPKSATANAWPIVCPTPLGRDRAGISSLTYAFIAHIALWIAAGHSSRSKISGFAMHLPFQHPI
jgi:hypothetical protein